MAWHDDGDGVAGAGASHRANGFGPADRVRDLRVSARRPAGNALQLLPNAALKRGGLQIKREFNVRRPAFDALQHFLHPALEAVRGGGDFRARVFLAALRDDAAFVVAEIPAGTTAPGGRSENFSERGVGR